MTQSLFEVEASFYTFSVLFRAVNDDDIEVEWLDFREEHSPLNTQDARKGN